MLPRRIEWDTLAYRSSARESDKMGNIKQETDNQLRRKIVKYLTLRGWYVEPLLSNAYHDGIPVLYCFKREYGFRWVEPKRPDDRSLTRLQWRKFSEWEEVNLPIWILTAATQEQYDLLFGPPNWRAFIEPSVHPAPATTLPTK